MHLLPPEGLEARRHQIRQARNQLRSNMLPSCNMHMVDLIESRPKGFAAVRHVALDAPPGHTPVSPGRNTLFQTGRRAIFHIAWRGK